jgi:hypothetical protein
MTPRDPLEMWKAGRQGGVVPEGFSDRVMNAVHAAQTPTPVGHGGADRRGPSPALSVLALAASVMVVVACHAALAGAILLALTATAH